MYIDYSVWETFEYTVNTLKLDLNNPRIRHKNLALNQTEILKYLINNENVYELAKKISEEGYFVGEEPIICIEGDKKIVLEGNRRVGALKLLQDPQKYLSRTKSNVLLNNISKNNFPIHRKINCFIAPNRLLANPIIYERHNGFTLHRWKTGNQYAFVAEMYYEDGLTIEDICDVLNESKAKILKPLKAYNLFLEGKEILEKEAGIIIDISSFEFTNLERLYNYEPARKIIGFDFDNNSGELIINLPKEEFEKRLLVVFKKLIDAERFSRDFNKEEDKKRVIKELEENETFDFSTNKTTKSSKSRSANQRSNLEEKKNNVTNRRKKQQKKLIEYSIIPRDTEITFEHEKLDELFFELKNLHIDKKYSFAILLRTYLEQSLYYYLYKKSLLDDVVLKTDEQNKNKGLAKVQQIISHIKGKYSVSQEIDFNPIMSILRFDKNKEYAYSLKIMLDYVKNYELSKFSLDASELRNLKQYITNVKDELDLAVHNINNLVDAEHNRRAWKTLELLFKGLSNNINNEE